MLALHLILWKHYKNKKATIKDQLVEKNNNSEHSIIYRISGKMRSEFWNKKNGGKTERFE